MVVEANRSVKLDGAAASATSVGGESRDRYRHSPGIGPEANYEEYLYQKGSPGESISGSPSLFEGEELLMSAMMGMNRKKLVRSLSTIVGKLDCYADQEIGERELALAKRVLTENLRRSLVVQSCCDALLTR